MITIINTIINCLDSGSLETDENSNFIIKSDTFKPLKKNMDRIKMMSNIFLEHRNIEKYKIEPHEYEMYYCFSLKNKIPNHLIEKIIKYLYHDKKNKNGEDTSDDDSSDDDREWNFNDLFTICHIAIDSLKRYIAYCNWNCAGDITKKKTKFLITLCEFYNDYFMVLGYENKYAHQKMIKNTIHFDQINKDAILKSIMNIDNGNLAILMVYGLETVPLKFVRDDICRLDLLKNIRKTYYAKYQLIFNDMECIHNRTQITAIW